MLERLELPAGDRGDLRCRKSSFTGSFAWTVVTEPDSRWMGKQSTVSSKKGRPMMIRACAGSWTCGVSGRSCRNQHALRVPGCSRTALRSSTVSHVAPKKSGRESTQTSYAVSWADFKDVPEDIQVTIVFTAARRADAIGMAEVLAYIGSNWERLVRMLKPVRSARS